MCVNISIAIKSNSREDADSKLFNKVTIVREYHIESKNLEQTSAKEMEWVNGLFNWFIRKTLTITYFSILCSSLMPVFFIQNKLFLLHYMI